MGGESQNLFTQLTMSSLKIFPLFLFPCCVFCIRARILEIASHGVLWGWFWATVLESLWIFCWLCRQWWSSLWWLWWIFKWERTKCTSQVMIVEWPLWSIGGGYSLRDVSYCFVVRLMRLSLVFCSMVRIFPLHRPCPLLCYRKIWDVLYAGLFDECTGSR